MSKEMIEENRLSSLELDGEANPHLYCRDDKIAFCDLAKINQRYQAEIAEQIDYVIKGGRYLLGGQNEWLCESFADFCHAKYCVALASGFEALAMILEHLDLKPTDEVIVAANAPISTLMAISRAGAKPVLVEPAEATFNIDPHLIEAKITPKTKVLVLVHRYGQICDMAAILPLAQKYNLKIVEDCRECHGVYFGQQRSGSLGYAAAFSFKAAKNLDALGDGGAITTGDRELFRKAKALANYGSHQKGLHIYKGGSSHLHELQAAVLIAKLPHLDNDNHLRRIVANFYNRTLSQASITLPAMPADKHAHVWHRYAIRTKDRVALQDYLAKNAIETLAENSLPNHLQVAYHELAEPSSVVYPLTTRLHQELLFLPISPAMEADEVRYVAQVINAWQPN